MSSYTTLPQNLKQLREQRNLSQEELSNISKVNYNTLIKIENGSNKNPTLKTLASLAKGLEVNLGDLIEDKEGIKKDFNSYYQLKDEEFNTRWDRLYESLVNFSQTKESPIHRWFYYVEGYSPQLVRNIFQYLAVDSGSTVFDPFIGSGTTLFVAKESGMESVGFEINPFSAFAAGVKTRNYSAEDIAKVRNFQFPKYQFIDDVYERYELRIIHKLFSKEKLSKIELLKEKIDKVKNKKIKDLLNFALLSIVEDVSNYRKGGNGLKKKTVNKDLDPYVEFKKKLEIIANDLPKTPEGKEPVVYNDSCLNLGKYTLPEFDISVFSPPYANCFDPFEVYKIELWVGDYAKSYENLRSMRKRALTSNLNANVKQSTGESHKTELLTKILSYLENIELWDKRIPKMIDIYFYEMLQLLQGIYEKTKRDGHCVIVVGNSSYGNLVVPTDILLAELGKKVGFKVNEIVVGRKNETSSQQQKKLGKNLEYVRESLIFLQK